MFANDALMIKQMEIGGKKMGTVIAVLFIKGTYAYITWLGDSRVYKFSKSKMDFCNNRPFYCSATLKQNGHYFFYL